MMPLNNSPCHTFSPITNNHNKDSISQNSSPTGDRTTDPFLTQCRRVNDLVPPFCFVLGTERIVWQLNFVGLDEVKLVSIEAVWN